MNCSLGTERRNDPGRNSFQKTAQAEFASIIIIIMSCYGLGLGAIHLLYLARDVALNLNCLILLHLLPGTYTLGQEGACVYGYAWKAEVDVGVFLIAFSLIFLRHGKDTCSLLILLGWLASEQQGAPSPPPQHWATGVFNCTQLFSWVLEI